MDSGRVSLGHSKIAGLNNWKYDYQLEECCSERSNISNAFERSRYIYINGTLLLSMYIINLFTNSNATNYVECFDLKSY